MWASAIRPDGSIDFTASKRLGNASWYSPPNKEEVPYATLKAALVFQRTSNRDQQRRLNAAAVPKSFRELYKKGFVAENHVIVLEALTGKPAVTPSKLAKLLNSKVVNERFSSVAGTYSVSAKLLQRVALPSPDLVNSLDPKTFEQDLRELFWEFEEVLAPLPSSDGARYAKDAIDEPPNLQGSLTVDQDTGFKRRAVA